jgi:serine/alanine adding enzyme
MTGGAPVRVVDLSSREAAWESFLEGQQASLYHRLDWKALIESVFGHRCHYRVALQGETVCGVLPLVEMKSPLFGHFLVSLPFFNYGGILAESPEVQGALAQDAIALASHLRARHIELRQSRPLEIPWTARQNKVALVVPLARDPSVLWDALSSRLRGKVRKAAKGGSRFTVTGPEGLADFYAVFAVNMRDLGTPVYSRRLFETALAAPSGAGRLLLVHREGAPVAAALALRNGTTLELPWICSNYAESAFNVNEFLYWSAIEWACHEGYESVDLGRSSIGAGTHRFKMQWNPQEIPLRWYYWTAHGRDLPQLNPENPKYRLAIRCWQKLPVSVANLIGPHIVRSIP